VLAAIGEPEPRVGDEIPDPVCETRTSDGRASEVTRAPMDTARPPAFPSIVRHSPVCTPARTSIPSGCTASTIAWAHRIPRAGRSNAAKKPSPAVSSSLPR
jgi:hypothetical protein